MFINYWVHEDADNNNCRGADIFMTPFPSLLERSLISSVYNLTGSECRWMVPGTVDPMIE